MKVDIIIAGVTEQDVLATASVISLSGIRANLHVGQSQMFRPAERQSAFTCHVRIADHEIPTPQIAPGEADLVLGLEPFEARRAMDQLAPSGSIIASIVAVRDFDTYPDEMDLLWSILRHPRAHLIDARRIAGEAGAPDSACMALVGAATDHLPIEAELIHRTIEDAFRGAGQGAVEENLAAYEAGRATLSGREIVDEFEMLARR